jgi:hypothetical protein
MATWRRRFLGSAVTVIVAAGWVLFVRPPRPVIRALVNAFPTAVLTGSDADTGVTRFIKRSLHLYVKSALASYVAERLDTENDRDEAALLRIVAHVRELTLNQTQVPHAAKTWLSLASGLGYCDQINGVVAHVASHRFRRAQLYALYDAAHKSSPHTIGRIWSDERRDWLYFDASFDAPIVFAKRGDGVPEFVDARARAVVSRGRPAMDLYSLPGWVMNEYRPSVAGQLEIELVDLLNADGPQGLETPPAVVSATRSSVAIAADEHCGSHIATIPTKALDCDPLEGRPGPQRTDAPPDVSSSASVAQPSDPAVAAYDQAVFERVARSYAAARLEHLLDDGPNRAAYLAIADDATAARDARAAEFVSAARVFATTQ